MNIDPSTLDELTPEELEAISEVYYRLSKYANYAARAKDARLKGNVGLAEVFEANMEHTYNALPDAARW